MIRKATEKAMPKMYIVPDILYAKQAKEEKVRTEKNRTGARSMPGGTRGKTWRGRIIRKF